MSHFNFSLIHFSQFYPLQCFFFPSFQFGEPVQELIFLLLYGIILVLDFCLHEDKLLLQLFVRRLQVLRVRQLGQSVFFDASFRDDTGRVQRDTFKDALG